MASTFNAARDPEAEAADTQKFRSQMGHISRHSGVFFAGTLFTAAAGYLFKVYVARELGAETLGLYALGMTVVGLFSMLGGLGLAPSAVRFVAAYQANKDFLGLRSFLLKGAALLLTLNLAIAVALLVAGRFLVVKLYHSPALVRFLPLFASLMVLGALTGFWSQVLVGYRDVSSRALINNFFGSTAIIVLTVGFFSLGFKSLAGYLMAQFITALLSLGLLLFVARRLTPPQARGMATKLTPLPREVLHFSAAVFGIDFLKFVLSQSDKIFIGVYLNPRDVGIYSIAAAIVVYVAVILQSVNQIFAPTIADLHARHEVQLLARLFQTLTKWIIALTLPIAAVVIVFAQPIMGMFGRDFEAGWPILVLGTIGQLVSCGVGSVGFLLLMSGNQKQLLRVQIGMAVVMILMNVALIPVFGVLGAALAAAVTNAGTNLWNLHRVRSILGLTPYNRTYVRLLPPTLAMLVVLAIFRLSMTSGHSVVIVVFIAGVVSYATFVGIMVTAGLDPDDRLIVDAVRNKFGRNVKECRA